MAALDANNPLLTSIPSRIRSTFKRSSTSVDISQMILPQSCTITGYNSCAAHGVNSITDQKEITNAETANHYKRRCTTCGCLFTRLARWRFYLRLGAGTTRPGNGQCSWRDN